MPVAGCTFSGPRATTGSRGGQKPGGKVTRGTLSSECYSPPRWTRRGAEDGAAPHASRSLRARSTIVALPRQSAVTAGTDFGRRPWGAHGRWRIGRCSTRPVLKHGPRSLTRARVTGLARNPRAQRK